MVPCRTTAVGTRRTVFSVGWPQMLGQRYQSTIRSRLVQALIHVIYPEPCDRGRGVQTQLT